MPVLSFRTVAILPAVLFSPTLVLAIVAPGSSWGTALGILFHLSALFFVSRVPAPEWARAAAFGWLALDVTVGIMTLNLVPFEIYMPMRLGGHVLGATWLIAVSLLSRPVILKVLGVFTGVWLALFSFFGASLPIILLGPAGVLIVVWFVIAGFYQPDPLGGLTRKLSPKP
ncbi:hypothetical protein E3O42_05700 [Cryobacterium adonitolivorans]|uniref:DUF308 domain-containing protein n=1 Tax=Cryobacterium adonitolivorans TaxID=1259189 RepID=A0A4R8W7C7_9MICO|nr:hypothetical protein [Cryobacterium adonitolivorans]TFC04092.1 hypothetical protein E3O42_05700 [Cryobacterium adonitolivorans]